MTEVAKPSTSKVLALSLSVLGYLTTSYAAVSGQIPAEWAGIASAVVALLYLASRYLKKVRAGADPKSLFATTEFIQCALVSVANLGLALAGKVSFLQAGGVTVVLGGLLKLGQAMASEASANVDEDDSPTAS